MNRKCVEFVKDKLDLCQKIDTNVFDFTVNYLCIFLLSASGVLNSSLTCFINTLIINNSVLC